VSESDAVRVLVVDDDVEARRTIEKLVERSSYRVVGAATDGVEAVEQTVRLHPDVVVMDLLMPRLDGIEAARQIRAVCPTPVVVMSGHGDREHLGKATDAGVGAFLTKPVAAAELDRAITVAMARFADQQELRRVNRDLEAQVDLYRQQVERNRRVLDAVMDGYCLTDGEGRIVDTSEAYCKLVGYSREELLCMRASDLGIVDGAEAVAARLARVAVAGADRFESKHRRKDGRIVDVDVSVSHIPAEDRYFVLVRDISARTRTEQLLRIQRDLANDLAGLDDIATAMRRVLDACLAIEGMECGGVYLVDPLSMDLNLVCDHDLSDDFLSLVGQCKADSPQVALVREGRACYLEGAELPERSPFCSGEGLRAVAVVPVLHNGAPVAALNVGSRVLDRIEPWVRDGLEGIAAQIGGVVARLRAQQALHESQRGLQLLLDEARAAQQRLADIIDFLPDATFVVDKDRRVIAWNRAIEEMTGMRKEDILGQGDFAYAIPFYGERRPVLIDLIGLGDVDTESKYAYVRKTGRTLYAEVFVPSLFGGRGADVWVTASALLDSGGNEIGAIESVRDITIRKRALEALKLAEAKYRGIFENAFEGIFQTTPEGRLVTANPALARILGHESAEQAIERCSDFGARVYADPLVRQQLLERVRHEDSVVNLETEFLREDGRRVWVSISVRGVRGPDGELRLLEGFIEDVTERRQAEKALLAEKAFSDAVIDNIPGTFFVIDERRRFVRWNRAVERISGWSAEELREIDPFMTVAEGDRPRVEAAFAQTYATGAASVEGAALHKDGREVPFLFTGSRVGIEGASYLIGAGIDLSERRRAEDDLRRSEERFAKAFRSSPAAVVITTLKDGRLLDVNETLARLLGYSREELIGHTVTELGIWDAPEDRERLVRTLGSESRVHDWECRFRSKDGRVVITRYSAEPVELGGEACLLSVLVDVTEQKRAAEQRALLQGEVAEAAEEWRATFDAVKAALIVTAADGTVRRCNAAARALSGKEWAEIIGQPIGGLGDGEPWRSAALLVRRAGETGSAAAAQVHSEATGRTWSVEAGYFGGREWLLTVGVHDITAVLELQSSLRQKETMAAMGSLLGGVAHEVRNPLFAISGLLDALDVKFNFGAEMAPYLEALRRETDRMTGVMRSLLEYGRPVSDERQPMALDVVLREAVQLCQRDAAAKVVAVTIHGADALPAVAIDHARMLEVFRNLVENGIQHSPSGGRVALEARLLPRRPEWIEVQVKDSGAGFSEGDRPKVFEPFFSRRVGGTGLGLSIVQRVVAAHGGQVRADNLAEGGGVVTVEIPVTTVAVG
jgi:PAS domain S-box-containing protein